MSNFILFCGFQALFLGGLQSIHYKKLERSAPWLITISIILGLSLIDGYLLLTNGYEQFYYLIGLTMPLGLALCPNIYAYITQLSGKSVTILFSWHYLPAGLCFVLMAPLFFFDKQQKIEFLHTELLLDSVENISITLGLTVLFFGLLLQTPVYVWLIWNKTKDYREKLINVFSSENQTSLNWLYFILSCMSIVWLLTIVQQVTAGIIEIATITMLINHVVISLIALIICYLGFDKQYIFHEIQQAFYKPKNGINSKYSKSSLDDNASSLLYEEVCNFIQQKRCYLEPGLTSVVLSEKLDISTNHLSQSINQNSKTSFLDFINRFRIEYAKELLKNNQAASITSITYEAGFNSKSAFYSAFKKFVGQTPSEFRKQ